MVFKATGLSLNDYCTKYLHCNHKAFSVRARLGRLYPNEMIFMCWHLNLRAKDLFGNGFFDVMMTHGQPGVQLVTDEVKRMFQEKPDLLDLLDLPGVERLDSVLPSVQSNGHAPEKEKEAFEKPPEEQVDVGSESDDNIFNDFNVVR